MTLSLPGPFWLIGCGNMAGAMLARWLECGLDAADVTVVRPSGVAPAPGVRTLTAAPEDEVPAMVLLGVKPQKLDEVAPALAPALDPATILVSLLAGVEIASLRARFAAPKAIVRAMPNTPVRLGKGVVELIAEGADARARAAIDALVAPLGHGEWFEDEALFALAGHLSGAGPAFLFRFIDALAGAGAALGLPPEQAARLAKAMVEGAGALAAAAPEAPAELARRVASPGGTTEAGLKVLDEAEALQALVRRTLDASRRRGIEMAASARAAPPPA
ncbi:MAG TPA: pyrroline-5-carboxylate reductase dimerization domain-containing protein [Allosphingosinicella sp.]|jgi:pyrroline-5-carboxylate reductase